jgi:hypothetical protein
MAAVTIERIAAVHAHITDAVVKTTRSTTLSAQEIASCSHKVVLKPMTC